MWIDPIVLERADLGVRLEPIRLDHAPGLFRALDHDDVWRLRPDPRVRLAIDMAGWIDSRVREVAAGSRAMYAIVIADSGEVAGTSSYLDLQPENRSLEIGATIVTPPWQRTFVNTACKILMLGHAFERLRCLRVQFKVDTRNERSQRAVERLGAVREGVLRKSKVCHDGYIRDTAVFSILQAEWPSVRTRLEGFLAHRQGAAQPDAPNSARTASVTEKAVDG